MRAESERSGREAVKNEGGGLFPSPIALETFGRYYGLRSIQAVNSVLLVSSKETGRLTSLPKTPPLLFP